MSITIVRVLKGYIGCFMIRRGQSRDLGISTTCQIKMSNCKSMSLDAQNLVEILPVVFLDMVLAEHPHDVCQGLVGR